MECKSDPRLFHPQVVAKQICLPAIFAVVERPTGHREQRDGDSKEVSCVFRLHLHRQVVFFFTLISSIRTHLSPNEIVLILRSIGPHSHCPLVQYVDDARDELTAFGRRNLEVKALPRSPNSY